MQSHRFVDISRRPAGGAPMEEYNALIDQNFNQTITFAEHGSPHHTTSSLPNSYSTTV
jgi:hypothetical protein